MKRHWRAFLSLAFGLLSVCPSALVWVYIFYTERTNPGRFDQQGSLLITLILFPCAFMGAIAFGVLSVVFCALTPAGGPWWRWVGPVLIIFGLFFAVGACIGPQMLAHYIP